MPRGIKKTSALSLGDTRADRETTSRAQTVSLEDPSERSDFWIDPALIPEGLRYEWKTETVLGQPAPSLQKALMDGWTPVTAADHPELVPPQLPGREPETLIRRFGLILLKKDERLVRQREQQIAKATVDQRSSLHQALGESKDPRNFPRVKPQLQTTYSRFDD